MEYVIIGKERPKYSYNFTDGKLKWLLFPGKRVDLF